MSIEAVAVSSVQPTVQSESPVLAARQAILAEVGFSHIPLEYVPLNHERIYTAGEIETAAHELHHAMTALLLAGEGVIDKISVHPDEVSLGRTIFTPFINLETFKLAAAAGALATPFGQAQGYSHDLWQVSKLTDGVWSAVSSAGQVLSAIPAPVKEKMAEIVAHLKVVKGSQLQEIYERAVLEAALEQNNKLDLLKLVLTPTKFDFSKFVETKPKHDHSRSEYLGNDQYRFVEVKDGVEKTTVVCGACGGENGAHAPDCPANKKRGVIWMADFPPAAKDSLGFL